MATKSAHEREGMDFKNLTQSQQESAYFNMQSSYDPMVYENTCMNYFQITGMLLLFYVFNTLHWSLVSTWECLTPRYTCITAWQHSSQLYWSSSSCCSLEPESTWRRLLMITMLRKFPKRDKDRLKPNSKSKLKPHTRPRSSPTLEMIVLHNQV